MPDQEFDDYIQLSCCKPEGEKKKTFGYKPILQGLLAIAFGAVLFIWEKNLIVRMIGGILFAIGIYVCLVFKDHAVISVYTGGVLIYSPNDREKGYYFSWPMIRQWSVKHKDGLHVIFFRLTDGRYVYLDTFNTLNARKTLATFMPDKEIN